MERLGRNLGREDNAETMNEGHMHVHRCLMGSDGWAGSRRSSLQSGQSNTDVTQDALHLLCGCQNHYLLKDLKEVNRKGLLRECCLYSSAHA